MNPIPRAIYISAIIVSLAILASTPHGYKLLSSSFAFFPLIIIMGWIILAVMANGKPKEQINDTDEPQQETSRF